ncbi:MAG: ATP-binding protein [Desulfobacteraceae bacterium]
MATHEFTSDSTTLQGHGLQPDSIVVHVVTGLDAGKTFQAAGLSAVVGRSAKCEISIRDGAISRTHLKIRVGSNKWFVQDLYSRNGTQVRGKVIGPGVEVEVFEGDRITLGATTLTLERPSQDFLLGEEDDTEEPIEGVTESLALLKAASKGRSRGYQKNMELLLLMSRALMETVSLPEIFQRLVDYLFKLFKRIDRAAILQKNPVTGELKELIARSRDEGSDGEGRPYSRTIVDTVLSSGKPIMIPDFDNEENLSDSQRFIRSVLCVPMISRTVVHGVIYVDSLASSYSFREADLFLLDALSSPAAVAMENAALVANLEQSVERKTEALRKAQEQLRESEIRFKAVFQSMNSGAMVLEVAEEGQVFYIIDTNQAALQIEDKERNDFVGKRLSEVQPFAKASGLTSALERVWRSGRPETLSVSFATERPFPSYRTYYLSRLPSHEIVALYDDVTDKKLAEKEQRELQLQLFTAQKTESIALIAGGVAHNFRNILQAVNGNIEYLEILCGENPEVLEITKSVYDSVRKGADLASDLLQFSKRTEDTGETFTTVDLSDVIQGAYTILSRSIDQRIEIALDLQPGLFVRANTSLLSQVFMNLFTNARDAMPEGGKLRVEARKAGNKIVARVSDTGIGMDPETLERVFEPFFTLKDVGKGTGLGLSTSRSIVEQHRGRIEVSSAPGEGSTFEIHLPASGRGGHAEEARPRVRREKREEKVLIVDDDPAVLDGLGNLVLHLGYRVRKLSRPSQALEVYREWHPDLVLVDRNMPEMDGPSCIRKMVEQDPAARIVIVSGYLDAGDDAVDEEIRSLIKGYLNKPCDLGMLSETITQALDA